jgi:endoglucanase
MSDMLEAPEEGAWGPAIADSDFAVIRDAGFATVRLPVAWSQHAGKAPPYALDGAFLVRVHRVVDLATAAGLNVVIDMHNYPQLMADPDGERARFVALWTQVARSFSEAPPTVWFELLNEPHGKLDDANLGGLYGPALAAIRVANPSRVVIVGAKWNKIGPMLAFDMPDDPHVAPSFHYYEPFAFTHQGAAWLDPAPPVGRTFGSAQDKAELDAAVETVRSYMARTGRVPFLGEFGASDDPRVPTEQRLRYYAAVSSAFASIGVQSCAWGYRSGFRLRDGDHWLPGALQAIAAPRP